MKIKIWGSRGSIPSPLKAEEVEEKICQAILGLPEIDTRNREAVYTYVKTLPPLLRSTAGGNTSCVEIQAGGEIFIIDAGSGLRELGLELMKGPCGKGQGVLRFFFSHAHWDHIQGFPFFMPVYIPGNRILIHSIHDLQMALHDQQRSLTFPVPFSRLPADIQFISIQAGQPLTIGKVQINTIENAHPGQAYSYRFQDEHSIFVYASDSEYKHLKEINVQPHVKFFKGADALIFDAQYTLRDAWLKEDWGHSSAMIGVDLARAAGVKKLILFHHDPTYSDTQLQEIQSRAIAYQAQDSIRPPCEVIVAYEGLTLDLTPPGAVEFQFTPDHEAAILTPSTVFDEQSVDQLAQQLVQLDTIDSPSNSIIDLSQVEMLTTAGLKLLVELYRKRASAPILLAGPSTRVREVLKLGGYEDYFAVYSSVEAALAALQARQALSLPGQLFKGRYQIESKIGGERLDTMLKATDIQVGRTVALKILSPYFSQAAIDRLMSQAPQLIGLDHPSIAKTFEAGRVGEHSFIVEEFVYGQNLQELFMSTTVPLSLDQAFDIATDLTLALEYIHSRGVIHGDLKPYNIFLMEAGIKLTDVSMGRLEEGRNLLNTSLLHLTAAYLAPEQILGQPLDARTDLYALGVIFYELFTGQLPFTGSDQEIMQAHLDQAPRPPRELNPHLSPSLEHLILKLLAKNPSNRYVSAEQARNVSSNLLINLGDSSRQSKGPFIGRESELQTLQNCWEEAKTGRGQLVFISGEPGIGKTSLAQQVIERNSPPIVLIGHCQEPEGGPAYHPFTELLRSYLATVPPEFLDAEAGHLLSNFIRLAPEIRQMLPHLPEPPPLEPRQEQLRLMSNFTQFIRRATQERPWLIILDDLQWADQSSLELMRYLSHHLPSIHLLIIGIYRDADLAPGHPLLITLRDLSSQAIYHHFRLDRLSQLDLEQMLTNLWKQSVPLALIEKIYQHTGGNPFYIEEVAKWLVDDGIITTQNGAWHFPTLEEMRLPRSIHEAVWSRIRNLSPDTHTLLRQAAVLGQVFKFDDLCKMSGSSEWEVLEHLDVALERQLIQEAPGDMSLRFSHAEIQYVLYTDMGPLRRRMLHHQAGEALEQSAQPEPERIADQLAHHFSEAHEFERALIYSLQAARQGRAAYANEAALLWYSRTLELLKQLGLDEASSFQPIWLSTHRALGEVLALVGRYDEALTHYDSALALIKIHMLSPAQVRQLADLYCQIAQVHGKRGEYDLALEWVEKGLNYLDENELTIEMARLYLVGAQSFEQPGKLDKAIEWCQKSLTIAAQIKIHEGEQVMAQAYTRLGSICLLRGYFDLVIHFCHEAVEIYRQIGETAGQINAYNNLGLAYFYQGEWSEADKAYTHSLATARQIGDIHGQSAATDNLALIYLNRGEWEQALNLFKQNCAIWQQIGALEDEAVTLSNMARVYIAQEDWGEAWSCLSRSQMLFTEIDTSEYLPELERRWGEFYLMTDKFDSALSHTRRSIDMAVEQGNPLEEGKSRRVLGQIYLNVGRQQPAKLALYQSLQILNNLSSKYEIAKTRLPLAHLMLETGSLDEAQLHLVQATQTFEELQAKIDLMKAQNLERTLHQQLNKKDKANDRR
jgi:anti-anti-sigma factor